MEEFTLKFKKDGTVWMTEEDGIAVKEKEMEPNDFIKIVQDSIQYEVTDRYGVNVTRDCIYYGVVERMVTEPNIIVGFYREPRIWEYSHHEEIFTVGYPPLLFFYNIMGEKVIRSAVVAINTDTDPDMIKGDTPLYYYPYGNTMNDGCIACLGSYRYPKVKDPVRDTKMFPEGFLTIDNVHTHNGAGQPVKEMLLANQDKHFDPQHLVFFTTFEKFIEKFGLNQGAFQFVV